MPIRTVGLTPGHRWCGALRSVKPAVNNGKGAHGLVHGPNSLNATSIRPGRITDRTRKLARDLRNGHLVTVTRPVSGDRPMDIQRALHPTDQSLSSYGLGKLDDDSAEAVNQHLEHCPDCRQRVAEMSAYSFLKRVRGAQKPSVVIDRCLRGPLLA
jgi:Putative zinc-finger